jgi:hypothetical protein
MTEAILHEQITQYLRLQYSAVLFRTDYAAGIKMTIGQAGRHKRLQSGRAWPDLFVAEPRRDFSGLFLELKREGTRVWLKDGKTLVADPHIREQAAVLQGLVDRGYFATFAVGFDEAKLVVDRYLAPDGIQSP